MADLIRTKEEPRRYLLGDAELPGVTDILTDAGYIDKGRYESFGHDGYYRERGSFIHEACDLIDRGIVIDWGSVNGYEGYVTAYDKARRERPAPQAVEQSLYHGALCFAGTIDRRYTDALGDLKTAKQTAAWWRLQLVAYAILVGRPYLPVFDLQLKEDGTFRYIWITPEQYRIAAFQFLAALADFHRKRKLPAIPMRALVLAAVSTLSAIEEQYGLQQDTVRAGKDEADCILAGRDERTNARREISSECAGPERAADEARTDRGDRRDAGERRRAA